MNEETLTARPFASRSQDARIPRYTLAERINHWVSALTYMYLLITGLGFWSPYLFWLTALVGGGPAARFWHPWVGLLFTGSIVVMYSHWRKDMRTNAADRAWRKEIGHYIRNEDEHLPAVGKFNFGQKLWYWLMIYGTIFLLLSGIGLWLVDIIPWELRVLRYIAILIHVGAALVTIGGFIIHVYMSTVLEEGSFSSMVEGTVPKPWARQHHRLWYDQVTDETAVKQ